MAKSKTSSEPVTRAILKVELDIVMQEIDEKSKGYRDQVLTGLDGVMKELETIREENAAGTLLIERISGRLDDHEERISNLESPAQQ
ncbi:MAG: hypothetical protein AAB675_02155 [Patescibacteria group bacterium]